MKLIVLVGRETNQILILLKALSELERVCFFTTPEMKKTAANLSIAVQLLYPDLAEKVETFYFPHNSYTAVKEKAKELFASDPGRWAGDLTGATKLMSLGLYEALREKDFPGFYVDSQAGLIWQLKGQELTPFISEFPEVPAEAIFAAKGYRMEQRVRPPVYNKRKLINFILTNYPSWEVFSTWMRSFNEHKVQEDLFLRKPIRDRRRNIRLDREQLEFCLQHLVQLELVSSYLFHPNSLDVVFSSKEIMDYLAHGWWLEDCVYRQAKKNNTFFEVYQGVILKKLDEEENFSSVNSRFEVDVLLNAKGQLTFISCKTGKFTKSDLAELEVLASHTAGIFARKLLVLSLEEENLSDYLKQLFRDMGITVYYRSDLLRLSELL
ncbi:MAG: hypothetical protein PWQ91_535 [Eubacteriales bacterium]|nr:hypothetical protein [Eubacteriales bacterium]